MAKKKQKTAVQILSETCNGRITSWATVNQAQKYILLSMRRYAKQQVQKALNK